jgi:hypothetical protein
VRIKWLRDIAVRLGSISAIALTLAACGAVTGTSQIVGGDLQVLPAVADLFPDVPVQFSISGGTPGYSVFSSNSVVLPLDLAVNGTTFTAVPKNVTSDTPVTITVRDKTGKTNTAAVTVRPAVLNNTVTFTALPPDGIGCGANTLCSGGNAQVRVTALLNGTVLQNRSIRFDVYQGDYQIVTPATGVLVNSITVMTDERGEAVVRLAAATGAPTQVATLTITDVASGLVRRFNFNIVSRTLSSLPSGDTTFIGAKGPVGGGTLSGLCPSGTVDYYIFGGTPPYRVASPLPGLVLVAVAGSVFAPEAIVTTNGGSVTADLFGCGGTHLIVTDAIGTSIETSQIIGVRGADGDAAVPPVPFAVSPTTVSLSCGAAGTVTVTGGTGSFSTNIVGGPSSSAFTVTQGATTITFTRINGTLATPTSIASSPITVNVTSGSTVIPVNVTVPLNCPSLPITAAPSSVTLPASTSSNVTISGGTPPYNVSTSNATVATATVSGNTVTITGLTSGSGSITVTDSVGSTPATIPVTVTAVLAVTAFPSIVTVNSTVTTATSTISGGTLPYTVASSDTTRATVSVSGNTVTITRVPGATSGSATIFVRDSASPANVATIAVTIDP